MLRRIQSGEWPVGSSVPGERVLIEEFGVSRLALREALSKLRVLGILDTVHGRGSVVRQIDATALTQLFPLILALDGEHTVEHMFELRIALESRTAYLAALRRTGEEADALIRSAALHREQMEKGDWGSIVTDMEFHLAIAGATRNPLFPSTLGTITEFVKHVRLASREFDPDPVSSDVVTGLHEKYVNSIDCSVDPVRRMKGILAHEAIAEAIRDQDPERARVEMEAHLRYSALNMRRAGRAAGGEMKSSVEPPILR
jgi:GntR family transcriptional regulator, transcriptional repressor for pyruvate dehydrogenase complex